MTSVITQIRNTNDYGGGGRMQIPSIGSYHLVPNGVSSRSITPTTTTRIMPPSTSGSTRAPSTGHSSISTRLPMLTQTSLRRDPTPLHTPGRSYDKHRSRSVQIDNIKEQQRDDNNVSTTATTVGKKKRRKSTETKKEEPPTKAMPARNRSKSRTKRDDSKDSLNEGIVNICDMIQRVDDEEIVINKYEINKCLGQGNFACVSKCIDIEDKSVWAMKEIDLHQVAGKEYCIENEAAIVLKYRHPCICSMREAFLTPYSYYLVLDMAENGDLFDAIKKHGPFTDDIVARVIRDAADALRFLHKAQIVHRDIKPENLLLSKDYHVKLTDFGLACQATGKLYRVCGTPTYVAPEVLAETGYGIEADLWSLGIIMHILLVGYAPFRSSDRERLFQLIKDGNLSLSEPVWQKADKGAKRLLSRMLTVDVEKRITAGKILSNKWLTAALNPELDEINENVDIENLVQPVVSIENTKALVPAKGKKLKQQLSDEALVPTDEIIKIDKEKSPRKRSKKRSKKETHLETVVVED